MTSTTHPKRRARLALGAAALIGALALGGCAAAPELTSDDASEFQARVVAVAERAVNGDYAAAGAELALLETAVAEASASGRLADDRATRIADSIALVRADLDAQIQTQQAAEQAARDAEAAAQQAAAEEAARLAAEQAAAEEAARRAAEQGADEGGNGDGGDGDNSGPGNNDGNGNGNGNGRGNGNGNGDSDGDDE